MVCYEFCIVAMLLLFFLSDWYLKIGASCLSRQVRFQEPRPTPNNTIANHYFLTAPLIKSCNWAVGATIFGAVASYEFCYYRRRLEKQYMKRAVEIIDSKKAQKEKELERKRKERREAKERLEREEEEKKRKSWWKVW